MSHILPSFLVIRAEGDSVTLPWAADVEVSQSWFRWDFQEHVSWCTKGLRREKLDNDMRP